MSIASRPSASPSSGRRRRPTAPLLAGSVALALVLPTVAGAAPGDLHLLAGGYGGGPATGVGLVPGGATVDGGRLLVTDQQNGVVRSVELSTGRTDVVVGTGAAGSGGIDRPRLLTQLPGGAASQVGPQQTAVLPDGDVLVSVVTTASIRRVDAETGLVSIVAGTGVYGDAGTVNGAPATSVTLTDVRGLAVEPDGAILLADSSANRIRRIAPGGTLTTVAGGGAALGDGGAASAARVQGPRHLFRAANGDLLIAEFGGHRVRRIVAGANQRIDPSDPIETVAGDGTAATDATTGDGGPATAARLNQPAGVVTLSGGGLVIAEAAGRRLRFVSPSGTISTLAIGPIDAAVGLAVRGTRVYVPESGNGSRRVREITVDPAAGTVTGGTAPRTIVGNGTLGFSGEEEPATRAQITPSYGVDVGPDGAVALADTNNYRVRAIDPDDGRIRSLTGDGTTYAFPYSDDKTATGPALETPLYRLWDVAVGPDGAIYQLESNGAMSRISRRDPATGELRTIAGGANGSTGAVDGPADEARFGEALAIAAGNEPGVLYVADNGGRRIRRIDVDANAIVTVAGNGTSGTAGDGGPALEAQLGSVPDIDVAPDGDVLIADSTAKTVRRLDVATGTIDVVAGGGSTDESAPPALRHAFSGVYAVAAGPDGRIAVADTFGYVVQEIAADGSSVTPVLGTGIQGFDGESGPADEQRIGQVRRIAYRADGGLVAADAGNQRVWLVEGPAAPPALTRARPGVLTQATVPVDVTLEGSALEGASVDLGPGIAVEAVEHESPTRLVATVRVGRHAPTGPRAISVTDAAGRTATLPSGLTVAPLPVDAAPSAPATGGGQPQAPAGGQPPAAGPSAGATTTRAVRAQRLRTSGAPRRLRLLAGGVRTRVDVRDATAVRFELRLSGATARRLGLSRTSGSLLLGTTRRTVRRDGTVAATIRPSRTTARALRAVRARGLVRVTVRAIVTAPGASTRTVRTTFAVRPR